MPSFVPQEQAVFEVLSHGMEQKTWEYEFECMDGVQRIAENNQALLSQVLAECSDPDTYLTSPTYYLFTGRHGLWIYKNNNSFLLVCWHPNVSGQILIFAPHINSESNILSNLLETIPVPPEGIRIARIKRDSKLEWGALPSAGREVLFERSEEDVLDWKYPVHILSTSDVAGLVGGRYMRVRNHLRQLNSYTIHALPLDLKQNSSSVENLFYQWATTNADSETECKDLYSAYHRLFTLALNNSLGLGGVTIHVNGVVRAVALWELPSINSGTANLFVSLCDTSISRLSELLIVKSCEMLHERGITHLNLGGSETAGLDIFKRKFRPIKSIELYSTDVEVKVIDVISQSHAMA